VGSGTLAGATATVTVNNVAPLNLALTSDVIWLASSRFLPLHRIEESFAA